jgi:hypothetical protein
MINKWVKGLLVVGLAEFVIAAALAVLFHFQVQNEKRRIILQSNIVAMSYALQPQKYTVSSTRYFYEFGYPNITSIFQDPMRAMGLHDIDQANFAKFSIWLKSDIDKEGREELRQVFENPKKYRILETAEEVTVNIPLYHGYGGEPYGIVQIATTIRNLPRDIFYKNFFLYLAIILLYNSQILLLYLYRRQRKRETVVYLEKGYLKEHAIGALKLQHKILGDIIADHEHIETPPGPESHAENKPDRSSKVIVLDKPKRNS